MIDVALWYVIVLGFGLIAWPIAFRFLPGLADRGYTVSRAFGLLLTGYVFWLLSSLGLLNNSVGGILFAVLIVGGFAAWAYTSRLDKTDTLSGWLGSHKSLVVVTEVLFLVAFAGWAFVRAYNPALDATERPMELAFLNGIRQSRVFPPIDPWLSGYSISYYYFGYVIMTMLAELANTPTAVAFNIGIALLFSLTLVGSYGLVYNLASSVTGRKSTAITALIGPLLSGVMGNLEGFLELVKGLNFPALGMGFWTWLDIENLSAPVTKTLWPPDDQRFWWWWRASRVIHDRDLTGASIDLQPIDEFPFFSFLLGDMHPHVLALPFVLLALALAFNVVTQKDALSRTQLAIYTICFGGLAFLNTWDLPIYLFILLGALALRVLGSKPSLAIGDLVKPVGTGLAILGIGIAAYLPWYITFTSQAAGFLPNALFPTRFQQYFVMFGPMLIILTWFLVDHVARNGPRMNWGWGAIIGGSVLLVLVILMAGLSFILVQYSPDVRNFLLSSTGIAANAAGDSGISAPIMEAFQAVLGHRLTHPITALFLTLIVTVCIATLLAPRPEEENAQPTTAPNIADGTHRFVFLLILAGAGLTLVPEFAYLRDGFGQRLNTVFKFYYAAWLLFSVASGYALHAMISRYPRPLGAALSAVAIVIIGAGLVYPAFAIPAKMEPLVRGPGDAPPTLNGIDFIRIQQPDDYQGILWLQQNAPPGSVVLEAVGGSYSPQHHGRVSSATGLPTIIGWPYHEAQWRGSHFGEMAGGREAAVKDLYTTNSIEYARSLLAKYNVRYVFVGSLERDPNYSTPIGLAKFDRMLTPVYQNDGVTIYYVVQSQDEAQQ